MTTQVFSGDEIDVFITNLPITKPTESKYCLNINKEKLIKYIDIIHKKNIKKTTKQRKIEIQTIHNIKINMWSRIIKKDREYWYARWMVNGHKFQSKCIDLYTLVTKFRNLNDEVKMRRKYIDNEYDMNYFTEWSNKILKTF